MSVHGNVHEVIGSIHISYTLPEMWESEVYN